MRPRRGLAVLRKATHRVGIGARLPGKTLRSYALFGRVDGIVVFPPQRSPVGWRGLVYYPGLGCGLKRRNRNVRICCLNNYSLRKSLDMSLAGLAPGQHGWGLHSLRDAGHDVVIAPYYTAKHRNLLERASRASRHTLGQLDQQLWAIRQRPDVIYSADQHSLAGLAMVRSLVPRHPRMISVVHHPMLGRGARLRGAAIRAQDVAVALNQVLCDQLTRQGIDAHFLRWGPDLKCGLYDTSSDDGFAISTGKSNRDISTLVAALARTGTDGLVYDLGRTVTDAPANVRLIRPGGAGQDHDTGDSYLAQPVLDQARAAAFVAIPITNPERLTGLTEINDALALGKPIIITRSRYTPVDVEAVGCGIVVEVGDVGGWVNAIERMRDPQTRLQMGRNGRQFAELTWNYETFGTELVRLIEGMSK